MAASLLEIYNKISIQQYKTDMGFKALVEGVHENVFVIPEYQRKYRWTKEQVEELATSLVRDLPIPPIYTFRNEKGQLEILDGQQRVMSLYFYFIGKFFKSPKENGFDYSELDINHAKNFEEALEEKYDIVPTQFFMKFGEEKCDISYQTLPIEIRRKVDYLTISVVEIKIAEAENRDATLHKIFTNLNNGGKRLSDQELRNGIYPCAFSKMVSQINKNNGKWRKLYGPISDTCDDIELLYRFCTMKKFVEYDGGEFKIPGYRNSVKDLIDDFAELSFSFSKGDLKEYQRSLGTFIDSLNISKKYFKHISLVEGIFVLREKINLKIQITDEMCEMILKDKRFQSTTGGGTISITNMNKRWKVIYELLSEYADSVE